MPSTSCCNRNSDKSSASTTVNNETLLSKKRVSFCNIVKVTLIPCIQEYKDADLFSSLWGGRYGKL